MENNGYINEALDRYMSEITSRIVAETGIASDRYHLGKLILQGLKEDPEFVSQIDGGTGESETNESLLRRSIRCATSFRNMGLKTGDVMILMAPNHLDQAVPFYAALFEGIIGAAIDRTLGVYELKDTFATDKPKIIFCQSEKVRDVQKAVDLLGLDTRIVSFDSSPNTISFSEMMEKYGEDIDVQDFKTADFDAETAIALIVATSGTTGSPKAAILTHNNIVTRTPYICCFTTKFPFPTKAALILSPLQWLSAIVHYIMAPFIKYTRVQSSMPATTEHIFDMIKKYEPSFLVISPPMMISLLKAAESFKCDFSSFDVIYVGGSAASANVLQELRSMTPNTKVAEAYGMSELGSMAVHCFDSRTGSCGSRLASLEYKLMNVETGEEVKEANKCGELWLRAPGEIKGYYNNTEATAEAITPDKWFKTGDLMYRDDDWYFYFVDRIKLLLKYQNHQISPVELEAVIRQHPGVSDVAVTGVPDPENGELPIAFVVPRPGAELSEQDIKDLVKENLTDTKQLRGGVVFLKELPLTATTKVDRRKLKELVLAMKKETAL